MATNNWQTPGEQGVVRHCIPSIKFSAWLKSMCKAFVVRKRMKTNRSERKEIKRARKRQDRKHFHKWQAFSAITSLPVRRGSVLPREKRGMEGSRESRSSLEVQAKFGVCACIFCSVKPKIFIRFFKNLITDTERNKLYSEPEVTNIWPYPGQSHLHDAVMISRVYTYAKNYWLVQFMCSLLFVH